MWYQSVSCTEYHIPVDMAVSSECNKLKSPPGLVLFHYCPRYGQPTADKNERHGIVSSADDIEQ